MFNEQYIEKRKAEDKIIKTNCYICGLELKLNEAKRNPENESDTRIYCIPHWKKRYGKKKRLLKRY